MPLPAYGLLIGKVVASRPQTGGHPHWLVMVQPSIANHPAYRVAVNLQSTEPHAPPEVQYLAIDVETQRSDALKALVAALRAKGQTNSFLTGPGVPAVDFVRGGLIRPDQSFETVQPGPALTSQFEAALTAAIDADESDQALLAVFGTGYPINPATQRSPSTGYTGIDNIHMNQGAPNRVGAGNHYRENGANQDGGLIFLLPDGARAFFVKFQSQTLDTDANGNPVATGVPAIDAHLERTMQVLRADDRVQTSLAALAPPGAPSAPAAAPAPPPPRFVFADPDPQDATETFVPDTDAYFSTAFVTQQAQGQVRGPVPTPRVGPVSMALTDVTGPSPPGYSAAGETRTIAFDLIGDSGAVTAAKLKGEMAVGERMTAKARQSPPAFLFHVGDVVYYYGEKQYYYGQFAEVFQAYPAPIFAIPGNHDALTYAPSMNSLEAFQAAFCAAEPGPWDGFGGVRRSTMTQPGVYFTLDAPLVSIIGLYSNCGESLGWLNKDQYAFLLGELQRLAPLRASKQRAVILAIHHFPRWFPGRTDPASAALDAIFKEAGLWPDAVVAGHAHLYQRIVRQTGVGGAPRDIPYFVNGAGGYNIVPGQKIGGQYLTTLGAGLTATVFQEGFMRASVTQTADDMTLSFDFFSTKQETPADSYSVTLV